MRVLRRAGQRRVDRRSSDTAIGSSAGVSTFDDGDVSTVVDAGNFTVGVFSGTVGDGSILRRVDSLDLGDENRTVASEVSHCD